MDDDLHCLGLGKWVKNSEFEKGDILFYCQNKHQYLQINRVYISNVHNILTLSCSEMKGEKIQTEIIPSETENDKEFKYRHTYKLVKTATKIKLKIKLKKEYRCKILKSNLITVDEIME